MLRLSRHLWQGSLLQTAFCGNHLWCASRMQHLNIRLRVVVLALSIQDLVIEMHVKIGPLVTQTRVETWKIRDFRARRPHTRCRVSTSYRSACGTATASLRRARLYSTSHRHSVELAAEDGQLVFGLIVCRRCKYVFFAG